MSARQNMREGRKALPLHLIAQALPMLTRHELAAVTERLIERLDELDGDSDLEDSHDQEAIDEREEDRSDTSTGYWDIDQRYCVKDAAFMDNRVNVDAAGSFKVAVDMAKGIHSLTTSTEVREKTSALKMLSSEAPLDDCYLIAKTSLISLQKPKSPITECVTGIVSLI